MPIIDEKKAKSVSDSFKAMNMGYDKEKSMDMPQEKDKSNDEPPVISMDAIKRRLGML